MPFNELGLSPAARCGFFSQLHDRAASGCTPQAGGVREYSSYFWSALQGKSKDNPAAAVNADYDGDGRTSLAEAHAYAVINSEEIDVPVRYVGFEISNRFVIGYGLDFAERYRNLPYVAVLNPELVPNAT